MRPGYLNGYQSLVPKHFGFIDKIMGGGGGKSSYEPPPGAPTPGSQGETRSLTDAYDKETKKYYVQNSKCEVGDKAVMCSQTFHSPQGCKVSECCDVILGPPFCIQDCGPDVFVECDEDPNYVEFPEPAAGRRWSHCGQVVAAFAAKGIPAGFAQAVCDDEDLPANAAEAAVVLAKAKAKRPFGWSARNAKGECPPSHRPVRDAGGNYCAPCPQGQLWNKVACQQAPPPCECSLPRTGGPFGKCPPVPPSVCGPAPQHQKCTVKGWGLANPVCKCNKWMCPNVKDLMMARKPKAKSKAKPRAKPKVVAKPKVITKPKPLAGFGDATANVIPKILVAGLVLGPVLYILGRKFI
jgi:hypothetical protein